VPRPSPVAQPHKWRGTVLPRSEKLSGAAALAPNRSRHRVDRRQIVLWSVRVRRLRTGRLDGLSGRPVREQGGSSAGTISASLGCGAPTESQTLSHKSVLLRGCLDLGSGRGADVLIAALRVTPRGR